MTVRDIFLDPIQKTMWLSLGPAALALADDHSRCGFVHFELLTIVTG
jgi:hypothetical protein